jgi:hypothetical protein
VVGAVEVIEVVEEGVERDKCRCNIQARSKAIPDRRDKSLEIGDRPRVNEPTINNPPSQSKQSNQSINQSKTDRNNR